MPFPLIPLAVVALAGTAVYKVHKRKSGLTPERKKVFDAALENLKEPEKLRTLATSFENEGLKNHADMLRKRAALRELPAATKDARRVVFKKAMASKDPAAVQKIAEAFHKEGATGAAANLRKYASGLVKLKTG
jgi:hypothetical protein